MKAGIVCPLRCHDYVKLQEALYRLAVALTADEGKHLVVQMNCGHTVYDTHGGMRATDVVSW